MTARETAALLVVVVAFRSDDFLPGALAPLPSECDVVVIDNDACEKTAAIAAEHRARYCALPANMGFAAAVNVALRTEWDRSSDVLLLNPDARLSQDALDELRRELHADAGCAAVGPLLVGVDGRPQRPDWPIPTPAQVWLDALGLSRFARGPRFVVGASLLLRGSAVESVGEFDERYFLYAEEADWQLRAHRAGWRVRVVDTATAVHAGAASSSDPTVRDRLFYASGDAFALRWYGRMGLLAMRLAMIFAATRRSLVGRPEARAANRRALRIHLTSWPDTNPRSGAA